MKKVWIIIWSLVNFAFSGFLAQPLTNFVKKQFAEANQADWGWLLDNRFSLLSFLIFGLVFLSVLGLISLVMYLLPKNRKKRDEKKINEELLKWNSEYISDVKVNATWEVHTEGLLDDNPFISNLQLFCMNECHHPVKMNGGVCPVAGCPNHTRGLNTYQIKDAIESELIIKKQSLKNKIK